MNANRCSDGRLARPPQRYNAKRIVVSRTLGWPGGDARLSPAHRYNRNDMANFPPVDEQLAYLKKGAAEIVKESELRAKLERSLASGKPPAREGRI